MKYILQLSHKNRVRLFMATVLLLTCVRANAQYEPLFTQYMFNETYINPAYAGSRENVAMSLLYRNQWVGLKGAPKTQTFSVHTPACKRKLGLGLSVVNETIGVSHQLGVFASVAYRILFDESVLSFGLQGGFINDEERFSEVNTIVQGDQQFTTDVRKNFLPNAGFGMYYYYENKFYAGFSVPRLLQNKIEPSAIQTEPSTINFVVRNTGNLKTWHYFFATGCVLDLAEGGEIKFKPSVMVKAVQNAPMELDVTATFLSKEFFWIGISYRTGDAIAALVGLQVTKQLRMGYSYDYSISKLNSYNKGSHEITVGYDFSFNKRKVISTRYF